MSVTNSLGCGQRKGYRESYSGFGLEVKLLKKVQLEIAINEDFVERTIKATIAGARTGQIGDGKVHSHPHGGNRRYCHLTQNRKELSAMKCTLQTSAGAHALKLETKKVRL